MVITSIMRRFTSPLFLAALSLLLFLPSRLAADLIWTPESGWHVEGGALAGIAGEDGRNALDLMNKARAAEEADQEKAALSLYTKVGKKYPNSVFASEALYHIGVIRQKRRQYYKAFDAYQQMLARYPNSEKFNQVIGEQYRIASDLFEGKRPRIWGVIPGFRNREKALEYFETIVRTAPYSDYAPLSLINASKGYKQIGESEAAIDALDRMINTYPRNVLTPDAYLKIAQTHSSLVDGPQYDQASTKEAITYYEDYMILFPGDAGMVSAEKGLAKMKKVLAESKIVMADYYFKYRHNYKAAKVIYNEAITVYPDSDVAKQARAKLAIVDAKLEQQSALPPPKAKPVKPQKKKRLWIF
ncbi:MAG TPA: tetratricopeptide repeat protein [Lacunisphaera sp.]|jgi:outer membrane protein assembly factor BamD